MSNTERAYTEKRTFIRMRVDTPVVLTLQDESNTQVDAICKDLSGTGMLVEIDHQVALGTKLHVAIKSGKAPFSAEAEVARIKTSPSGNYIHGLKLNEINEGGE